MTDLHVKLLKRFRVDQDYYNSWVHESLKKGSPYKHLFDKLNSVLRAYELLDSKSEVWVTLNYVKPDFKALKNPWAERLKQTEAKRENILIDIIKACKKGQSSFRA